MFIDDILTKVCFRLEENKRQRPLETILNGLTRQPRDFAAALRQAGFGIIAEIKRASPSKGWLSEELDILQQASLYERAGACAVSVLTEPDFFKGSLEDLKAVREHIRLPVLRKDFILEPYQIYESRFYGADALLLIAGILSKEMLSKLIKETHRLKMAALVEVHDQEETKTALQAGARLIGINNRNLRDFSVDLNTTLKLRPLIPPDILVISESGISTYEQARMVKAAGVNGILVGEALVTSKDPETKIRELIG